MLTIKHETNFKKDYKKAIKRGLNTKHLEIVVTFLANEETLPEKYKDHKLQNSRNYKNVRECHIEPDWLLIYQSDTELKVLRLIRTGSHSDLF